MEHLKAACRIAISQGRFDIAYHLVKGGVSDFMDGCDASAVPDRNVTCSYPMSDERKVDEAKLDETLTAAFGNPNVFPKGKNGRNILHHALRAGNIPLTRWIVKSAVDINALSNEKDNSGNNPFQLGNERPFDANTTACMAMLSEFVDLNAKDSGGRLPLEFGGEERVSMLLEKGADPYLHGSDGKPLYERIVEQIKRGEELLPTQKTAEMERTILNARTGTRVAVKIAKNLPNIDSQGEISGKTVLYVACETGNIKSVQALINMKANPLLMTNSGFTPLGTLLGTATNNETKAKMKAETISGFIKTCSECDRLTLAKSFFAFVEKNGFCKNVSGRQPAIMAIENESVTELLDSIETHLFSNIVDDACRALDSTKTSWHGFNASQMKSAVWSKIFQSYPSLDHDKQTMVGETLSKNWLTGSLEFDETRFLFKLVKSGELIGVQRATLEKCLKRTETAKIFGEREQIRQGLMSTISMQESENLKSKHHEGTEKQKRISP